MEIDPQQLAILPRVLLSAVLGGALGLERELVQKPAGLRTHLLVAASATLFVSLGELLVASYAGTQQPGMVAADPLRIIDAIVTAIGFLGAGTIIVRKQHVEGLTTASTILMAAAIGVTVGLSKYFLAVTITAGVVLLVYLLGLVEHRLARRREEGTGERPGPD